MTDTTLPEAASAEMLTLALRRSGALDAGRVTGVVVASSLTKPRSRTFRLLLSYSGEAEGAPRSLILKTGQFGRDGDRQADTGRREVAFYRDVATAMTVRSAPRCFEASWDPDDGAHLLLEDLTDTHVIATAWPLPPTTEHCLGIVRAMAKFHAASWDDPRLGVTIGRWPVAEEAMGHFAERYDRFAQRYGDLLTSERRKLYDALIDRGSGLLSNRHLQRNLTIIHGDAHVWNFFVPRSAVDDTLLFDWENWSLGPATDDLAYMMAIHWFPDRRRRLERLLLDHYHAVLVSKGVCGYDRRALDDDYRLSVLALIMRPIWQEAFKIPPRVWWNNLERIFMAVEDQECHALLT